MMTHTLMKLSACLLLSISPAVVGALDLSGCDKDELILLAKAGFTKMDIASHCRPTYSRNSSTDISGTWVFGGGGETWTFTPIGRDRYDARESGYGNAFGTATVNGNALYIEFECPNKRCKGHYNGTISGSSNTINATRSDGARFTFRR